MSIDSAAHHVDVFRFKETGIVQLCRDVVDFVDRGEVERYALDINGAHFIDLGDGHAVRFPRIKVKVDQIVSYRPGPGQPAMYGQVVSVDDNAAVVSFVGQAETKLIKLVDLRPTLVGA